MPLVEPLAEQQPRTRDATFPLFDSWRGIAALMVLFVHGVYQFAVTRGDDPEWYRFALHLDVAVPIFFGISGFLLYRPFVSARVKGKPFSIGQYARRRALRIIPAYWFALVVITYWYDFQEVKSVEGWLWYGGFLQLYGPHTFIKGLGQAWTLDIEVVFYAFLPIWVVVMTWFATRTGKARLRTEVLGVFALMVFAWCAQAVTVYFVDIANLGSNSGMLIRLPYIQLDHLGAGMLLAVLSVWVTENRRAGKAPPVPRLVRFVEERGWVVLTLGVAIWVLTCYVGREGGANAYLNTDRDFIYEHVLYTPVIFLLLAPAAFEGDGRDRARRLIGSRPLRFVGTISYSFYLWHYAIVAQIFLWNDSQIPETFLGWTLWLALATLGSTVVAFASYRLIEKPFMDLRYRRARP